MPLFKGLSSKSTPKKAIDYITRTDKAAFVSVRNLFEDEDYAEQFADTQEVLPERDSVAEYKKAKAEMARLGFETLDEYFDYMEFMKVKAKRNYATT